MAKGITDQVWWQSDLNWRHKVVHKHIYLCKVKVKFSHTRYWVLGPELFPVYWQSARRWLEVIHLAVFCHYFPPGGSLRLPSQSMAYQLHDSHREFDASQKNMFNGFQITNSGGNSTLFWWGQRQKIGVRMHQNTAFQISFFWGGERLFPLPRPFLLWGGVPTLHTPPFAPSSRLGPHMRLPEFQPNLCHWLSEFVCGTMPLFVSFCSTVDNVASEAFSTGNIIFRRWNPNLSYLQ